MILNSNCHHLIFSYFDDLILIMLIYYNFDDLIHRETNVFTANKKVQSLEEKKKKHGALIDLRATAAGKKTLADLCTGMSKKARFRLHENISGSEDVG